MFIGGLVAVPNKVVPAKKRTRLTESSTSEAVTLIVPVQGARNVALLVGAVIRTIGGVLAVLTVTIPVMKGWTVQMKGKLPAEWKVWLNVNGSVSTPESHKLGTLVLVVE
jgi:hypothetical protein